MKRNNSHLAYSFQKEEIKTSEKDAPATEEVTEKEVCEEKAETTEAADKTEAEVEEKQTEESKTEETNTSEETTPEQKCEDKENELQGILCTDLYELPHIQDRILKSKIYKCKCTHGIHVYNNLFIWPHSVFALDLLLPCKKGLIISQSYGS